MPGTKVKRQRFPFRREICPLCAREISLTADKRIIKHGHKWEVKRLCWDLNLKDGINYGINKQGEYWLTKRTLKRLPCEATGRYFHMVQAERDRKLKTKERENP